MSSNSKPSRTKVPPISTKEEVSEITVMFECLLI